MGIQFETAKTADKCEKSEMSRYGSKFVELKYVEWIVAGIVSCLFVWTMAAWQKNQKIARRHGGNLLYPQMNKGILRIFAYN